LVTHRKTQQSLLLFPSITCRLCCTSIAVFFEAGLLCHDATLDCQRNRVLLEVSYLLGVQEGQLFDRQPLIAQADGELQQPIEVAKLYKCSALDVSLEATVGQRYTVDPLVNASDVCLGVPGHQLMKVPLSEWNCVLGFAPEQHLYNLVTRQGQERASAPTISASMDCDLSR